MKVHRRWFLPVLFAAVAPFAAAQAVPTATQGLELTAFGAGTGTWTRLEGGRNIGVTAGADLAFKSYYRLRPAIEVRGTYPFHAGTIDAQKDFLGGLRVEYPVGRLHPYVDFLVGRGQIDYQRGGFLVGNLLFIRSNTTVYSPGVGVDLDLSDHWSGKADFQYQSWDIPFPPGTLHPGVLSLGAVYHFDFNHHYRAPRHTRDVVALPQQPQPVSEAPAASAPGQQPPAPIERSPAPAESSPQAPPTPAPAPQGSLPEQTVPQPPAAQAIPTQPPQR